MAYTNNNAPPNTLNTQNITGTVLSPFRSETIHCTKNRPKKMACAANPKNFHASRVINSFIKTTKNICNRPLAKVGRGGTDIFVCPINRQECLFHHSRAIRKRSNVRRDYFPSNSKRLALQTSLMFERVIRQPQIKSIHSQRKSS